MDQTLPKLPFGIDFETKTVLKELTKAHRALAELKGVVKSIPNEEILINTLSLQEAKDSSEVENIITTHDELYRQDVYPDRVKNIAAKEVGNYVSALKLGYGVVQKEKLLRNKTILQIQAELEKNDAGFRAVPGTVLKNSSGEVVYTPPQKGPDITKLMTNLESYINDPTIEDVDPLVKMALIHFQFESIHPFYDGNGRTGRIINVLYLVMNNLLDIPVLYLSRYIVQNKEAYYTHLQSVRDSGDWESWILYMLEGVRQTSTQTMKVIEAINLLMEKQKHHLRDAYSFYTRDLLDLLFSHPYVKVEFVQNTLGVSRQSAQRYLTVLSDDGILEKRTIGKANYFVNSELYDLLQNVPLLG